MANKRLRKLLTEPMLAELHRAVEYGVPVAKLLEHHNLDISRPALAKLIKTYGSIFNQSMPDSTKERVQASLFPTWVVNAESSLVVQPEEYSYKGLFPFGEWELNEND